jgi:CRISPR-associated protein Cmr3
MGAMLWAFGSLDTFFFRDGTPYNAGEGGATGIKSAFPPYMTTLQGAIRTALAMGQGWTPSRPEGWPAELGGPDDLGDLRLQGPYLRYMGRYLFPLPLVVVKGSWKKEKVYTRLVPGGEADCDLGRIRLPALKQPVEGAKTLEGAFVTQRGLETILAGGVPESDELYSHRGDEGEDNQRQLWHREPRVGIGRDANTRTAIDGRLYSIEHIRPDPDLSVVVRVAGLPAGWHQAVPKVIPLGGERRVARVEIEPDAGILPEMGKLEKNGDKLRFTATLMTPYRGRDREEVQRCIRGGPPGIPGQCISACIGRVGQLGGWDLVRHYPRPLQPLLPAGSTWFYEADPAALPDVKKVHGRCADSLGFGQIIIGRWEERV